LQCEIVSLADLPIYNDDLWQAPPAAVLKFKKQIERARDWFGLFAPAGTAGPIVARLSKEVQRLSKEVQSIMAEPAFQEKNLVSRGLIPAASTPEAFAAMIARDRMIAARS
jgi:tripartite-type tricarboxylate transporter receptor subunit TctC